MRNWTDPFVRVLKKAEEFIQLQLVKGSNMKSNNAFSLNEADFITDGELKQDKNISIGIIIKCRRC